MTRKDFILIARIMNKTISNKQYDHKKNTAIDVVKAVSLQFAAVLLQTNPLFDRERFLTACGLHPQEIIENRVIKD